MELLPDGPKEETVIFPVKPEHLVSNFLKTVREHEAFEVWFAECGFTDVQNQKDTAREAWLARGKLDYG